MTKSLNNLNGVKGAIRTLVGVSLFVAVFPGRTAAQPGCDIREMYKESGWTIPGLPGASVENRHVTGQGDAILVETLRPRQTAASITIVSCVPMRPGRIEIRDQAVNVQELRRYSALGHIFAYGINAEHVSMEGERRVALGATEVLMYYDLDGSGLFRLREYGSKIPYKLRIPDWVGSQSGGR